MTRIENGLVTGEIGLAFFQERLDAFVTGPASLRDSWKRAGFEPIWQEPVEQLPTFRMHRAILPKARLTDGLTLYLVHAA